MSSAAAVPDATRPRTRAPPMLPHPSTPMVLKSTMASAVHRIQEFFVVLGALELVGQELHDLDGREVLQVAAQDPHAAQVVGSHQELFLARARLEDVDGGPDALLGDAAIQDQFHV